MSNKLKNCPHCGSDYYLMVGRVEGKTVLPDNFQVVCGWLSGGCGASGGVRRTEAEAIAAWNQRADDVPEHPVDNAQADSRERLEANVYEGFSDIAISEQMRDVLRSRVHDWLDRQEAITRRECYDSEGWRIGLTREAVHDGVPVKIFGVKYVPQATVDSLTAERDELQSIIDHMPKTWQECEACQDAHDRLVFNAKVHQDELRDELKHKQLVIDRQRDSFLKLEAENAELRRMLADAAEAI